MYVYGIWRSPQVANDAAEATQESSDLYEIREYSS